MEACLLGAPTTAGIVRSGRTDILLRKGHAGYACHSYLYIVHSGPSPRIPLDCELLNGWQCAGDATHGVLNSHLQWMNCELDHFRQISQTLSIDSLTT